MNAAQALYYIDLGNQYMPDNKKVTTKVLSEEAKKRNKDRQELVSFVPYVGDAKDAGEAAQEAKKGNLLGAGIILTSMALPEALEKGARKGMTKFVSELDWSPESWFKLRANKKWDTNDVAALEKHIPEYHRIEKEAKENGTWLKMANGSTWQGDPRTWVLMLSSDFKDKYFNKSLAVDKNNDPLMLIHGSDHRHDTFLVQNQSGFSYDEKGSRSPFFHFGDDKTADYILKGVDLALQVKYPVFLKIDEFLDTTEDLSSNGFKHQISRLHLLGYLDDDTFSKIRAGFFNEWDLTLTKQDVAKILQDYFKEGKYKNKSIGIKYINNIEGAGEYSYEVPNPTQIKSAIGNNGNFDPTNPNMYKAIIPIVGLSTATAAANAEKKQQGGTLNYLNYVQ